MAAKEERKFILECLQLYKSFPALWNVKSQGYRNRIKKNEQYNQLLCKYRERYPNADRNKLVKKLNALRTNYRKELRRIKNALTSGTDKVESTLWYFDELRFLENLRSPGNSESAIKIEIGGNIDAEEDTASSNIVEIIRDSNMKEEIDKSRMTDLKLTFKSSYVEENSLKKKLNKKDSSRDKLITVEHRRLQEPAHSETECERIALAWAVDLEKMEPLQQLFAKKAINDILFEGRMGTLQRDSVQIHRNLLKLPSSEPTPNNVANVSPNVASYE